MEAAASLYGKAKVADRIPQVANVVISNVPGPPIPLYMGGAELQHNYPISVITDGAGLNITVLSYKGSMDFGVIADPDQMPDLELVMDALRTGLDALESACGI